MPRRHLGGSLEWVGSWIEVWKVYLKGGCEGGCLRGQLRSCLENKTDKLPHDTQQRL